MPRPLRLVVTVLVAVFLTGGQWAVLQSVAWTSMFSDYIRSLTLVDALKKTFDGENPCAMCCAIQKGRDQEKEQGEKVVVQGARIDFIIPLAIPLLADAKDRGIRLVPPEWLPLAAPVLKRPLRPPIALS